MLTILQCLSCRKSIAMPAYVNISAVFRSRGHGRPGFMRELANWQPRPHMQHNTITHSTHENYHGDAFDCWSITAQ